jgi:peptide deformylase
VPGTARPITLYGEPVLHAPCATVTEFGDELSALIDDMFASMYAANGVGLAANQIGVGLRVFVYDCADETDEHRIGHVVNPVLAPAGTARELDIDDEGCLSVPGEFAELGRPATATVTGVDKAGQPVTVTAGGMLGRCLQHEVDHLEGTVFVDRLPVKARRRILKAAGLAARP